MTITANIGTPPPFQLVGSGKAVLSEAEMDALVANNAAKVKEGMLGDRSRNAGVRRSQTLLLKPDAEHKWLFDRIWDVANAFNGRFFGVDLTGVGSVQLARYDASDQGFYDWHLDFGQLAPNRKLSMTIQLSAPEDYDGGQMELAFNSDTLVADRTRGSVVCFPSFLMHRVAPVTRGTRWSLVAWIVGPRWR